MNQRSTSIRAAWLACIILILLMSGVAFLLPGAGAAGSPSLSGYMNPGIYRASIPAFILNQTSLHVDLVVDSANVTVNTPTTLQATVTYENGTPAIGSTITLSGTGVYFEKTSFTATSSNTLVTKFQAPAEGSYTIKATATMDGYVTGTASQVVKFTTPVAPVTPTPTSTPLPSTPTPTALPSNNTTVTGGTDLGGLGAVLPYIVIVAAILLVILVVLAYLWFKQSLRLEPKKLSAPCDGKATIPVRVSFVNGFGMARRAKSDTEVALESTAGSIQSVVLQSGRDFVDATLTSSKEFGAVTITGRVNNKTAQAKVNFTYGQASLDLSASPAAIPADGGSTSNVTVRIKDESGNIIAPLEGREVELRATLGTIASPVKMPERTAEVSVAYRAADQSGTAVITALSGPLRGEARIALEGVAKRFCMHCGSAMSMEASECPKCGLTPPSGVDTKPCSTCGTTLPEAAKFCYKCGARQPGIPAAPTAKQPEPPK